MSEYKVGICDSDTYYVIGFMEYINLNEKIPIKVFAFSGISSIEDYIRKDKLDMLLLDEKLEYENAAVLISELTDIRENGLQNGKIYKYQSVEQISYIILKILDAQRLSTKNGNYVYGVYSPLGRCGKTRLAKGICNYYKDSIYIGFEAFVSELPKDMEAYQMLYDHFMYYLVSRNIYINEVIEELAFENGFKTFTILDCMDLKNITAENIEWLTDTLRHSHDYRRIVYDINSGIFDMEVLFAMDKIYVPVLADKVSVDKLDRFKSMMTDGFSELLSKINYIKVPDTDWNSSEIRDLIVKGDI